VVGEVSEFWWRDRFLYSTESTMVQALLRLNAFGMALEEPAFVRAKVTRYIWASLTREQHSERLLDEGLARGRECNVEATIFSKMLRKIISGGQTGADRAGMDFAIEADLEHGGYVPRGRKAEDGRIDDRYNLIELSTGSYPARTRRNIEKRDGTVIFSLERVLNGGTKLTLELAKKLGKPVLHIYDDLDERISNRDSLCLEIQVLGDLVCSNKIEILNVAGPRESEGARRLRLDPDNVEVPESGAESTETAGRVRVGKGGVGDRKLDFLGQRLFLVERVARNGKQARFFPLHETEEAASRKKLLDRREA
jgi:Circularly permutated YpsA SLOG family